MAFDKTMSAALDAPAIEPGELSRRRKAAKTDEERLAVELTPALTPIERVILVMLCSRKDRRTSKRFASQGLMASEVGCSRASMIRALARLELLGWVSREKRYRANGHRTTDMLTVHRPELATPPPQRLLPLVSLISTTPDYVAPCDKDYVAPCDLVPPEPVAPCNSISLQELSQDAREGLISDDVDKSAERAMIADGLAALSRRMGARRGR